MYVLGFLLKAVSGSRGCVPWLLNSSLLVLRYDWSVYLHPTTVQLLRLAAALAAARLLSGIVVQWAHFIASVI